MILSHNQHQLLMAIRNKETLNSVMFCADVAALASKVDSSGRLLTKLVEEANRCKKVYELSLSYLSLLNAQKIVDYFIKMGKSPIILEKIICKGDLGHCWKVAEYPDPKAKSFLAMRAVVPGTNNHCSVRFLLEEIAYRGLFADVKICHTYDPAEPLGKFVICRDKPEKVEYEVLAQQESFPAARVISRASNI